MSEQYYPSESNLGKDCLYWQGVDTEPEKHLGKLALGCWYPKVEMEGRLSCEGIIDDVCLYLKEGRAPQSLTAEQKAEIKHRTSFAYNKDLPPGDIS